MLIILPDPTTRRCLKHRELLTDSIPCPRCEGERIGRELVEKAREIVARAFAEPEQMERNRTKQALTPSGERLP